MLEQSTWKWVQLNFLGVLEWHNSPIFSSQLWRVWIQQKKYLNKHGAHLISMDTRTKHPKVSMTIMTTLFSLSSSFLYLYLFFSFLVLSHRLLLGLFHTRVTASGSTPFHPPHFLFMYSSSQPWGATLCPVMTRPDSLWLVRTYYDSPWLVMTHV